MVRVTSSVITDEADELSISLVVVLEDPPDPTEGWPSDAFFDMVHALNAVSGSTEGGMYVYVLPVAASSVAA